MEKKTGCVCENPGFCSRHNMNKTPHFFHLCQNHVGYFKMWEECRGPGQEFTECAKSSATLPDKPKPTCSSCNKQPINKPAEVEPPKEYPSLFQQSLNLGSALVDHIANGLKSTEKTLQEQRLEICNECPSFNKDAGRCRECGCYMITKTKWDSAKCPLGKW